jgi:hypothetical protein
MAYKFIHFHFDQMQHSRRQHSSQKEFATDIEQRLFGSRRFVTAPLGFEQAAEFATE